MLSPKQRRRFVQLGIFSLFAWLVTTFNMMILYYAKDAEGWLHTPNTHNGTVSVELYQSAADMVDILIFNVILGLTCGYLLIGLIIFRQIAKAKKEDEKIDDAG